MLCSNLCAESGKASINGDDPALNKRDIDSSENVKGSLYRKSPGADVPVVRSVATVKDSGTEQHAIPQYNLGEAIISERGVDVDDESTSGKLPEKTDTAADESAPSAPCSPSSSSGSAAVIADPDKSPVPEQRQQDDVSSNAGAEDADEGIGLEPSELLEASPAHRVAAQASIDTELKGSPEHTEAAVTAINLTEEQDTDTDMAKVRYRKISE